MEREKIFYFPVAIPRSRWNPLYWLKGDHKMTFGCKAVDLVTSKMELDTEDIKFVEK